MYIDRYTIDVLMKIEYDHSNLQSAIDKLILPVKIFNSSMCITMNLEMMNY